MQAELKFCPFFYKKIYKKGWKRKKEWGMGGDLDFREVKKSKKPSQSQTRSILDITISLSPKGTRCAHAQVREGVWQGRVGGEFEVYFKDWIGDHFTWYESRLTFSCVELPRAPLRCGIRLQQCSPGFVRLFWPKKKKKEEYMYRISRVTRVPCLWRVTQQTATHIYDRMRGHHRQRYTCIRQGFRRANAENVSGTH